MMRGTLSVLFLVASVVCAGETTAYRTIGGDDKLPWFQLKAGEFPPEGAASFISGEIIAMDHVNRSATLRPDRNDSQRTDDYDIAMPFTLLPYAKTMYKGSNAELRDVPIGTHVHGLFFVQDNQQKNQKPVFNRCLLLEDDFSYFARIKRTWRVDSIEIDKSKLTVTGSTDGKLDAKPTILQIGPYTRVWKGKGFGELKELAAGQQIFANLTVCTLKGPGRAVDVWLDDECRAIATKQQYEVHKLFQREHGLGCWIDEVDNKEGTVTVTFFDACDASLLKEFRVKEHVAAAVGEENLRTYDQINDTRRGPIQELKTLPLVPGSSGIQIRFKPEQMLEGYRPKRYLRVFAGGWRVDDLPREERLYR